MDALARSFVNPAMLLGALAIAAPIIIFLLTRFRHRTVDWAAVVFLQRAIKRQQRRLRLENLLLLLIRCLLLALFAAALARPRVVGDVITNDEDASRNVVLVLDTSYSTGYQVGSDAQETVYERARRAAKDIVAGLPDGDRVNVVAFDEEARALYSKPRQLNERVRREILQDLDDAPELQLSQQGTDLAEALHALPRVLRPFDFDPGGRPPPEGVPPSDKTVFLLGDAQRKGFLDANGQPLDRSLATTAEEIKRLGGHLVLLDCGAQDRERKNVSVVRLATREAVVGQGLPCHVEATVRNWSTVEVNDLEVRYYVDRVELDDRDAPPQKTVPLRLDAGETKTCDPMVYTFTDPGLHHVRVKVSSDALELDNERTFVVDVREQVKVLLVDGEPGRERWEGETDFVAQVLALSEYAEAGEQGLLLPEVIDEAQLTSRRLEEYDAIFVCNVVAPSDETAAALERYAREGGAVVFTVGELVDAQAYNDVLYRDGLGLLPVRLLEARGGTRAEAVTDEDAPSWIMSLGQAEGHPAALFAAEEMLEWLRSPSIFGFYEVELPGTPPPAPPEAAPAPGATEAAPAHPLVKVPLRVSVKPASDDAEAVARAEATARPLLVERAYGEGAVSVWLSTIDDAWNNCVVYDGFYLPFWRELVLDLAQRTRPPVNLRLGGRWERVIAAAEYAAEVGVLTPEGRREPIPQERVGGRDTLRLAYPGDEERGGLQHAGLYTVERKGLAGGGPDRTEYFAVALDTDEGDLEPFSADELQGALGGLPVQALRPEGAREALQGEGAVGGSQEYWREVIAAVIALLALESLLAAAFGRRRR